MASSPRSFERLRTLCADVDFDLERIRPSILDRMRLLAETTETLNDCERAVQFANDIFRYYDVSKPLRRFTALERRIVVIGTLFSDVGKSGPAGAAPDGQRLVAEIDGRQLFLQMGANYSCRWPPGSWFVPRVVVVEG